MPVEHAIRSLLSGMRVYYGRANNVSAADGAYLTINTISAPRERLITGASGYVVSRIQIDAYAETWTEARDTGASVIAALEGYRGEVEGVPILAVFIDSERDLPAEDAGEATHLFRRSIDVMVHHHDA